MQDSGLSPGASRTGRIDALMVRDLHVSFGGVVAIDDVSSTVRRGDG